MACARVLKIAIVFAFLRSKNSYTWSLMSFPLPCDRWWTDGRLFGGKSIIKNLSLRRWNRDPRAAALRILFLLFDAWPSHPSRWPSPASPSFRESLLTVWYLYYSIFGPIVNTLTSFVCFTTLREKCLIFMTIIAW